MSDTHRFNLLIPTEIWERIKASAKKNRRYIAQEVLVAIEEYLERQAPEQ